MENILKYAKFLAAVAGAGLIAALQSVPLNPVEKGWATVALAMATAITVYAVPNKS